MHIAFRAEVKRSTQSTAVTAGLIAIFAMPLWAGFDHVVDPSQASMFTEVRLLLELPLVLLWLALYTSLGRRHPELIVLLLLVLIQGSVAFMISRLHESYAPYTLGLSLALYGSSFLLIWPWRYSAALIGLTWVLLAAAIGTAPDPLTSSALATIGFYLGTASLVALCGQFFRHVTAWQEFQSRFELERQRDRNEELVRQLERLSREDPLTGLANRRSWDEALEREFERSRRHGSDLAVILCDLDCLKDVNDRFGHATGDGVLKAAADVLTERVRASDLAARLGGDEFAVVCPDTDLESATLLAEALRSNLCELAPPDSPVPGVTGSFGVAALEEGDHAPAELMLRADHRLYRAKELRNSVWADGLSPAAAGPAS